MVVVGGPRQWPRAAVSAARVSLRWPCVAVVVAVGDRRQWPGGAVSAIVVVGNDRLSGLRRRLRWPWLASTVAVEVAGLAVGDRLWRLVGCVVVALLVAVVAPVLLLLAVAFVMVANVGSRYVSVQRAVFIHFWWLG